MAVPVGKWGNKFQILLQFFNVTSDIYLPAIWHTIPPPQNKSRPSINGFIVTLDGWQPEIHGAEDTSLFCGYDAGSWLSHQIPRRSGRYHQHIFVPIPFPIIRFVCGPPCVLLGYIPWGRHSHLIIWHNHDHGATKGLHSGNMVRSRILTGGVGRVLFCVSGGHNFSSIHIWFLDTDQGDLRRWYLSLGASPSPSRLPDGPHLPNSNGIQWNFPPGAGEAEEVEMALFLAAADGAGHE